MRAVTCWGYGGEGESDGRTGAKGKAAYCPGRALAPKKKSLLVLFFR
jgi:hypothetical protein